MDKEQIRLALAAPERALAFERRSNWLSPQRATDDALALLRGMLLGDAEAAVDGRPTEAK